MGANISCCCAADLQRNKSATKEVDDPSYNTYVENNVNNNYHNCEYIDRDNDEPINSSNLAQSFSNYQFENLAEKKRTLDKKNTKDNEVFTNTGIMQQLNNISTDDVKTIEKKDDYILDEDLPLENKNAIVKILHNEGLIARDMSDELVLDIIFSFYGIRIKPGVTVYTYDENAGIFFIILSGKVKLIERNDNIVHLGQNSCFGKSSIRNGAIREEKAITDEETVLVCLNGEHYRQIIESYNFDNNIELKHLSKVHLFKHIPAEKLYPLLNHIKHKVYKNRIITEGDQVRKLYIITEGTVQCVRRNKVIKKLKQYDYFGDIYLLTEHFKNISSYFTYIPSDNAIIYEIEFKALNQVLGLNFKNEIVYSIFNNALKQSDMLMHYIAEDNLRDIYCIFSLNYYKDTDSLYTVNKKSTKLSILLSGSVKKSGQIIAKEEDMIGEAILAVNQMDHDILPDNECLVLEADWNEILKSIKCLSNADITVYERISKLKKIHFLSNLSEMKLFQLAGALIFQSYDDNDYIIKEGTEGDRFFILNTGKVKIFKNKKFIREMEAFNCFGELCFSKELEIRSATVRAFGYVECFIITYDNFKSILDEKLTAHIQKIISLQDYTINLTSLYFIKELGHGKFGKVYLVHNQRNFYAIKSTKIRLILKSTQLSDYFLREKNIMQQLDHPFIIKFVKTLKDSQYIYFLLEHVDGIPLRTFIDKRNGKELKNEEQARFFGGILFTAINYLHKKRIVHRDIKPDNCIINSNGYLKLIDFGISKEIVNTDKTMTLVGTPHYIAPEVLHGKGYGFSADYWSIGVVMFELFYGYYPFGSNSRDVMEIYKNIMEKSLLTLPYDTKFTDVSSFFRMILAKSINQRITNFGHIRTHPFFRNYDFDKLLDFSNKPQFIPNCYVENAYHLLSKTSILLIDHLRENSNYDDIGFNEAISKKEEIFLNEF